MNVNQSTARDVRSR